MFDELLEPVHNGEWELKNFLRKHGYKVVDVSDNPKYWNKDIDLLISKDGGKEIAIEVKYDSRINTTGNLFLEVANPRSKNGEGWFNFTQARYLFYGDSVAKLFYVIDMWKLREYMKTRRHCYRKTCTTDNSVGYLVPIANAPIICSVEV